MKLETVPPEFLKGDLNGRLKSSLTRHSSKTAIDTYRAQISYAQLEKWIRNIEIQSRKRLPQEDAKVVVLAEHPEFYVAAMLAVFRMGALYVPMDPKAPAQRTLQILEDVDPHLVLHQGGISLPSELENFPQLVLPSVDAESDREAVADQPGTSNSEKPAYLFYTSGSTGKPKGIVGKLSSLDHFVTWESNEFGLDHNSCISQFTTPTFDAFLRDVLVPLSVGGTLCIPPEHPTVMGSDNLWKWLEEKKVSLIHCVPSLFSTLLEGNWKSKELSNLKHVLLAGEALPLKHAADWLSHWDERIDLVNLYGSTETTMVKLFHRIRLTDIENGFIPVGKGMTETEVFVINDAGDLCSPGESGEIHVATEHRTLGYFNQAAATAKVFTETKHSDTLAYATGDLGTFLPDGNLRLLGRKDRQLKIGGVRIEPEEIERALLSLPCTQACAVRMLKLQNTGGNLIAKEAVQKTQPSPGENQVLTAYVVLKEETKDSDIRTQLTDLLPAPAIPRSFFSVPELPRNSNGKTDYHALPELATAVPIRDYAFTEVETETEKNVRDQWIDVLSTQHIGRMDNFFGLGGDSLKAMQIMNRLRNELGYDCRSTDLLQNPILKDFCSLLDQKSAESRHSSNHWEVIEDEPEATFPLTPAQKGLWFLWKMDPKSAYYTCQGIIHLKGRFDPNALKAAWVALLDRHEILRVRFGNVSGSPIQRFERASVDWTTPEDLSYLKEKEAIEAIRNLAKEDAEKAFDLENDPLLRSRLYFIADNHHALQLTMHEITVDLWAIRIMMNDLAEFYQAALEGRSIVLKTHSPNFRQYLHWQDKQNIFSQKHEDYWKEELAGELPVLDLPLDRSRSSNPSYQGKTVYKLLSPKLTDALKQLSQTQNNTLYVTLLTGFFWMLKRYTGQSDIIVGSPLAQRDRSENEHLMGFFLNMLPLRQQLDSKQSLSDLLSSTRAKVNGALEASDYPFTQILEWAKSARDTSISPVFQVMFNMLSYADPALDFDEFSLGYESLETGHTKYDFSLYAQEYGDRLFLQIAYQTELFDEDTMQRFLDNLETLYESMPSTLDQPLYQIPSIHPAEERLLVTAAKGPQKSFDLSRPLIEHFHDQVQHTPDATALIFKDRHLPYAQLNAWANTLAHKLIRPNSESDKTIGIHLNRGFHMVAAIVACMKINRPYVFLDPQYPNERLEAMAQHAEIEHLICESETDLEQLNCTRTPWSPDLTETIEGNDEPIELDEESNSTFSIVFTSASTGKPKGVRIKQSALQNRFQWMWEAYPFTNDDVMLLQKSLGLVASSWECLGGLLKGIPTVIADHEEVIDPAAFATLCDMHKVTRIYGSPALFKSVIEQRVRNAQTFDSLRLSFTSAEPISPTQVEQWKEAFPGIPLFNLYGSSECSSNAMEYACHELESGAVRVPLGKPLPNISAYILDEDMQPVPKGVVGELCIAGACLADGYHKDVSQTSEKFISASCSAFNESVLYRTGDQVRMRSDNLIEYVGRNDFQVKVRGFRIEPGEIENALRSLPTIKESAVLVQSDKQGGNRLIAFIAGAPSIEERTILRELRNKLPDYMVPSRTIVQDRLPRNNSGKIDRQRLREILDDYCSTYSNIEIEASSLESKLLNLWRNLLQRSDIELEDNFFDVGGHSLLAAQLFVEIEKETGKTLPVSTLYRAPTIPGLIEFLEDESVQRTWSTLVPIRATGTKTPLVCVTPWDGNAIYFRSLPKYLDPQQPIFSLEPMGSDGNAVDFESIEEMVDTYLEDLRANAPKGPLSLCGFSGGGVIALEIARKLREEGREVEGLYFFDTSFPGHKPNRVPGETRSERRRNKLNAHWNAIKRQRGLGKLKYLLETIAIKIRYQVTQPTQAQWQAMRREIKAMENNKQHFQAYSAAPYDGTVTLLKAKDRRLETIFDPTMGWSENAQCDVEIIEVPGGHNTMLLDPNDRVFCAKLQRCLDANTKGKS